MGGACGRVAQDPEDKTCGPEKAYAAATPKPHPDDAAAPAVAEPSLSARPPAYDVMISYAHKDVDAMKKLRERLVAEGLTVWVDDEVRSLNAVPNPCRRAPTRRAATAAHVCRAFRLMYAVYCSSGRQSRLERKAAPTGRTHGILRVSRYRARISARRQHARRRCRMPSRQRPA